MRLPINEAFVVSLNRGRYRNPHRDPGSIYSSPFSWPTQLSENRREQDWFVDGMEAARKLKLELGIISEEKDEPEDSTANDAVVDASNIMSDSMLESGRAAARALLLNLDGEAEDGKYQTEKVDESPSNEGMSAKNHFHLPSIKSHCMTICMVPPPIAKVAWKQLSDARRECRDPGFYRWPPHANMLYPFLEPDLRSGGDSVDSTSEQTKEEMRNAFIRELVKFLGKATRQCAPFEVTIDSFGTFGGKHRGVLWAYPKSSTNTIDGIIDEEPLIRLQRLLEEQFPTCNDTRKAGGKFNPHITISHYPNVTDALAAKEEVEAKWKPVSFNLSEIYLLERRGDEGQFKIMATIPLGSEDDAVIHNPPIPFPGMPLTEEDWVHEERMKMKTRRRNGMKRRRRKEKSKDDSEEE
ncbi:hypothetical protein ACHAXS_008345 [Conticribra weissflogii]